MHCFPRCVTNLYMSSIRLGIFSPCFSLTLAIQTSTQSPILFHLAFSSHRSSLTKPPLIFFLAFALCGSSISKPPLSPILFLVAFSSHHSPLSQPVSSLVLFLVAFSSHHSPLSQPVSSLILFLVTFSSHHSPLSQPVSSLILFLLALSKHRSQITTPHTLNLHPVFYRFSPCFFIVPTFHYLKLIPVSYPPPPPSLFLHHTLLHLKAQNRKAVNREIKGGWELKTLNCREKVQYCINSKVKEKGVSHEGYRKCPPPLVPPHLLSPLRLVAWWYVGTYQSGSYLRIILSALIERRPSQSSQLLTSYLRVHVFSTKCHFKLPIGGRLTC